MCIKVGDKEFVVVEAVVEYCIDIIKLLKFPICGGFLLKAKTERNKAFVSTSA